LPEPAEPVLIAGFLVGFDAVPVLVVSPAPAEFPSSVEVVGAAEAGSVATGVLVNEGAPLAMKFAPVAELAPIA